MVAKARTRIAIALAIVAAVAIARALVELSIAGIPREVGDVFRKNRVLEIIAIHRLHEPPPHPFINPLT